MLQEFIRTLRPKSVIEFGTQQGSSAIAIARALNSVEETRKVKVVTYDTFESNYVLPPHAPTGASLCTALDNVQHLGLQEQIQVKVADCNEVETKPVDFIHIDICNHKKNIENLLWRWFVKERCVLKGAAIEGFWSNTWTTKLGLEPWGFAWKELSVHLDYDLLYIPLSEGQGISLIVNRSYKGQNDSTI